MKKKENIKNQEEQKILKLTKDLPYKPMIKEEKLPLLLYLIKKNGKKIIFGGGVVLALGGILGIKACNDYEDGKEAAIEDELDDFKDQIVDSNSDFSIIDLLKQEENEPEKEIENNKIFNETLKDSTIDINKTISEKLVDNKDQLKEEIEKEKSISENNKQPSNNKQQNANNTKKDNSESNKKEEQPVTEENTNSNLGGNNNENTNGVIGDSNGGYTGGNTGGNQGGNNGGNTGGNQGGNNSGNTGGNQGGNNSGNTGGNQGGNNGGNTGGNQGGNNGGNTGGDSTGGNNGGSTEKPPEEQKPDEKPPVDPEQPVIPPDQVENKNPVDDNNQSDIQGGETDELPPLDFAPPSTETVDQPVESIPSTEQIESTEMQISALNSYKEMLIANYSVTSEDIGYAYTLTKC